MTQIDLAFMTSMSQTVNGTTVLETANPKHHQLMTTVPDDAKPEVLKMQCTVCSAGSLNSDQPHIHKGKKGVIDLEGPQSDKSTVVIY